MSFCTQAVVMTLEALSTTVEEAMCRLLKSLYSAIIITPDMMERVSTSLQNLVGVFQVERVR